MKKKFPIRELEALVDKHGSQEAAAAACGVVLSTFSRWITHKSGWPPKGRLVRERLVELGVPCR